MAEAVAPFETFKGQSLEDILGDEKDLLLFECGEADANNIRRVVATFEGETYRSDFDVDRDFQRAAFIDKVIRRFKLNDYSDPKLARECREELQRIYEIDILAAADRVDATAVAVEKFTFRDLATKYPTLPRVVIDGLLRVGETMNVVSYSKIGKSWLAYSLLLCLITGKKWLGTFATTPGRCLLVDNELHRPTIAHRIQLVAERLDCRTEDFADRLDILPLRGRLQPLDSLAAEFDAIEPGTYQLIVFDARYRFAVDGESENDNAAQARFYNTLDAIAEKTQAAIALVHHTTKGNQTDKRVTDVGAGGGSQSRAADTHLVLREHEEEGHVVLDAALRSFAPVEPLVLKWDFPCWWPADGLDPSELKGKKPKSQEVKEEQDRKDQYAIVDAMRKASGAVTSRQLRSLTGLGKDRLQRLLDGLTSDGQVDATETIKRGNRCYEYELSTPPN